MSFQIRIGSELFDRDFLASKESVDGQHRLARARANKERAYCMCKGEPGLPMFVRKKLNTYELVKFKGQGPLHDPICPSVYEYEGIAAVTKPAIVATSEGFDLRISILNLDTNPREPSTVNVSISNSGTTGSNRSIINDQSLMAFMLEHTNLVEWHPGFSGKRNWGLLKTWVLNLARKCVIQKKLTLADILVIGDADPQSPTFYPQSFKILERIEAINSKYGCAAKYLDLVESFGNPVNQVPVKFKHLKMPGWFDSRGATRLLAKASHEISSLSSQFDYVLSIFDAKISKNKYLNLSNGALLSLTGEYLPNYDRNEHKLCRLLVEQQRRFRLADRNQSDHIEGHFADLLDHGQLPVPLIIANGPVTSEVSGLKYVWNPSQDLDINLPSIRK